LPGDLSTHGDNWMFIDLVSGQVLGERITRQLGAGDQFLAWIFPLHTGTAFGLPGRIVIALAGVGIVTMLFNGFYVWGTKWRMRRRAVIGSRVTVMVIAVVMSTAGLGAQVPPVKIGADTKGQQMTTMTGERVAGLHNRLLDLVETDLMSLARAMPEDRYDFRPTGGAFGDVRTFGEQVRHVATMIFMTAALVLEERSPVGPGAGDNGPDDVRGKEAIVQYLERAITYARRAMSSLTEANHLDPLETFFGSQPRIEVAAGVLYHSYNHYGQMVVYARMNGVVPPSSQR
jgi:hypothetical protein